ncbi:carbohydrate ABC transporter permease [Schleiferilactobacillus harbinensis]|nr:carbohydrate ABC transporter permease [Schleiferilactobacillus harbinensis]MCT2909685.1 carbohydrate ABC transporter permease [Schleiferilactobacillus harbinensis]
MGATRKFTVGRLITYIFLVAMAVFFVGPLLFTIVSSFKNNTEIFANPFGLPAVFKIENWQVAWRDAHMSTYLVNSLLYSIIGVALILFIGSMVSYVLSRFNFRFNKWLSMFFLMGMMIPMHTIIVPVAWIIGSFDMKNNIPALIALYVAFAMPFTTAVLTNFMTTIPAEMEEAAILDGASYFQIYRKVILPMTGPGLSTVAIFNFLSIWNDVLFPLLLLNDNKLKTVALGLLNFNGERGSEYGPLMAAISITMLVPFGIYLIFQEKIENGIASGAVKG